MRKLCNRLHVAAIILLACNLIACKTDITDTVPETKMYLQLSLAEMPQFTRAISEGEIQDLNVYLLSDGAQIPIITSTSPIPEYEFRSRFNLEPTRLMSSPTSITTWGKHPTPAIWRT